MAITYDSLTRDGQGAFLIGQLERYDVTVNNPLFSADWKRDIDLRTDITLGHEFTSFSLNDFAFAQGNGGNWVGKSATVANDIQIDSNKVTVPTYTWAGKATYTNMELSASALTGQPVDATKLQSLTDGFSFQVDKAIFVGDTSTGATGLYNASGVHTYNVVTGVGGYLWTQKTPAEILTDVNTILNNAWIGAGTAQAPSHLRIPASLYSTMTVPLTTLGNMSILRYVAANCISTAINGFELDIKPSKWLETAGVGGTRRMVAYTKNPKYVQAPFLDLQGQAPVQLDFGWSRAYLGKVGQVEVRYKDTIQYADGI